MELRMENSYGYTAGMDGTPFTELILIFRRSFLQRNKPKKKVKNCRRGNSAEEVDVMKYVKSWWEESVTRLNKLLEKGKQIPQKGKSDQRHLEEELSACEKERLHI